MDFFEAFDELNKLDILDESLTEAVDEERKQKLQAICDELNRKYGYRHNDRFTNSNSPYYGMDVWHTVTYEPTEMWFKVAWPIYDKIEVNFSYRNLSDEDGIRKSRRCLDNCDLNKYGLEVTGDPEIEDSEKGWFDVIITLSL